MTDGENNSQIIDFPMLSTQDVVPVLKEDIHPFHMLITADAVFCTDVVNQIVKKAAEWSFID